MFNEAAESLKSTKTGEGRERHFLTLKSGKVVEADLICWCTGQTANTGFLQKNFSDQLDAKMRIKTNEYFQMEGFPNILAIGDVTAWAEVNFVISFHFGISRYYYMTI